MVARETGWSIRPVLAAPLGGALWGAVESVCVLVPVFLVTQHFRPDSVHAWAVVLGGGTAIGAAVGLLLSLALLLPLALVPVVRRRPYRDPGWAIALAIGPALVPAYLVASGGLEWSFLGTVMDARAHADECAAGLGAAAFGAVALRRAYGAIVATAARPHPVRLAGALASVAVLAAAALPVGFTSVRGDVALAADDVPRPRADGASAPPLLVVGLDGANWWTIRPLFDAGRLPTLARLVATGRHGEMPALWPPYWSVPAWGAMMTCRDRADVAFGTDMAIQVPGLPPFEAPLLADLLLNPFLLAEWGLVLGGVARFDDPPRTAIHHPPVWELLARTGIPTAVFRFAFTYPADDAIGWVVSNHVGNDPWVLGEFSQGHRAARGAYASRAARDAGLVAPFAAPPDAAALDRVLPDATTGPPPPSRVNALRLLQLALDTDTATFASATRLVRTVPHVGAAFVYVAGLDSVSHVFWRYRFPDDYGDERPTAAEVARFGGVIDRYLEHVDDQLGQLIAAYPTPPNVLVVSDHGHAATRSHPFFSAWHDPHALVIASGASVTPQAAPVETSYFDVMPTILDLTGRTMPPWCRGRSFASSLPAS